MFEYRDKDGDNEYNAEASISADPKTGHVHVGVYFGDMDGDSYTIYAPNHREALLSLASDIFATLEATKDWPQGFDGFSSNFAASCPTGDTLYGDDEEYGVVRSYG